MAPWSHVVDAVIHHQTTPPPLYGLKLPEVLPS